MIPKLVHVQPLHGYVLHLRFADGVEGDVDLKDELYGQIFEPLLERVAFLQLSIHPDFHTLVWANGADLAPEFLYKKTLESQDAAMTSHVAERAIMYPDLNSPSQGRTQGA